MEIFSVHWSNYNQKYHYIIGFLSYDKEWTFSYNNETISSAVGHGFRPFPDMPDITKKYKSLTLFSAFQNRLPYGLGLTIYTMKNTTSDLVTDKILIKHIPRKEN